MLFLLNESLVCTERLRPTPDTVAEVMKRPELLAGFNDPEVMAAVADIAADSQNLKKYKNSTKVRTDMQQFGRRRSGLLDCGVVHAARLYFVKRRSFMLFQRAQ